MGRRQPSWRRRWSVRASTVNSATFTGDATAAGLFNDPAASVGLARGIVMSSGQSTTWSGPTSRRSTGEDLGQAWRQPTRRIAAERPDDPGRRQPDRQFHPHQPSVGHQLRVRIGGVRGVRRHRVQRRLRVLRERDQLRAHAGHRQPDHGQHRQSGQQLALLRPERGRRPTTPSSTASPWSSRVAPRSIPASTTRCAWSLPIPATASSTPACSSRRTVSRRTRSGRCSRSRRTGCSTPAWRRRPPSALGARRSRSCPAALRSASR